MKETSKPTQLLHWCILKLMSFCCRKKEVSLQGNEIYDLYIVAQALRSTEICTAQSQITNFVLQGEGKDRLNTLAIHIERGDRRVFHWHLPTSKNWIKALSLPSLPFL